MDFGPAQIAIVLIIGLLVFGPRRLPELGKSLGSGMREFKDSITGKDDDRPSAAELPTPSEEVGARTDAAEAEAPVANR